MTGRRAGWLFWASTIVAASIWGLVQPALAAETAWADGFNSRTRLFSGGVEQNGTRAVYAFIEVAMPQGWKTYWRNPGDAGGLPPSFNWSRSQNLSSATVLYPAPQRLTDEAGDTIGYKDHVTFPVLVVAKDASKPIHLALDMNFGICKDICVPSEARHDIELTSSDTAAASEAAIAALASVPRDEKLRLPNDPGLMRAALDLSGATPKIVIEAQFPRGVEGADVFVEAPDGLYVPMPGKAGAARGDMQTFEAELGNLLEPKDLKGKTLSVTLVSGKGHSVATFKID